MTNVIIPKIPKYFYSLTDPRRWYDKYASQNGDERLILSPHEIITKGRRNDAYKAWLSRAGLPAYRPLFQAIQILSAAYSETNRKDWWPPYRDCLFRVFVSPYTEYAKGTKGNRQWYILCPEDCEMILRFENELEGRHFPPRKLNELYISKEPALRKVRLVPVECCRHWRHETTGGELPEGL